METRSRCLPPSFLPVECAVELGEWALALLSWSLVITKLTCQMSLAGEGRQKQVAYALNECIVLLGDDNYDEVTRSYERKREAEFWLRRSDPWEDDSETGFP